MARHRVSQAITGIGGVLLAVIGTGPGALAAPAAPAVVADDNDSRSTGPAAGGSTVMVLDSSGSMADSDGAGGTRIAAAREAVGTVVDGLPDGYPTGLRVYGADKPRGCEDTRLVKPVRPLDRAGIKKSVAGLDPKGDTPIGLSLRKAAQDLPAAPEGGIGRRSILLISDGEDNCRTPEPCQVAEQLGAKGVDLRIDAIGFQVRGKAREQLECIAEAGHGSYYDAPDAKALARQLERAARLSVDGYRLQGTRITGGRSADSAEPVRAGQYLDTIGPGETRWYSAELDSASAAEFAATAVPQPGVRVASGDGLEVEVAGTSEYTPTCEQAQSSFGQDEGAAPLTAAAARIPTADGDGTCDEAGRYVFSVTRHSEKSSDAARWPLEIRHSGEKPLPKGVTPAQSEPDYGAGGEDAQLPTGAPEEARGGTGFNDARKLGRGAWRDTLLPAQTRWYKVPVGWGQQLRYDVEFANEPTLREDGGELSFVQTDVYSPGRYPVDQDGTFTGHTTYTGKPAAVSYGTVPVSWTNRYETSGSVTPVHRNGDYYIAVTLGANAGRIAENTAVGVTLRVDVKGREKTGPQHNAPPARGADGADSADGADRKQNGSAAGDDGAGWSGPLVAAVAGGTGVALLAGLAVAYVRARRGRTAPEDAGTGNGRNGPDSTRGGAW